jgi:hypothetical protein
MKQVIIALAVIGIIIRMGYFKPKDLAIIGSIGIAVYVIYSLGYAHGKQEESKNPAIIS